MATVTIIRPDITDDEREKVLKEGAYIAALMLRDIRRKRAEESAKEQEKEQETKEA